MALRKTWVLDVSNEILDLPIDRQFLFRWLSGESER